MVHRHDYEVTAHLSGLFVAECRHRYGQLIWHLPGH